jgi:hypothetical protein
VTPRLALWSLVVLGAVAGSTILRGREPDSDSPAVRLAVDASRRSPISPFIYGLNFRQGNNWGANDTSLTTLNRFGGNRLTAFNWETGDSNCGSDCGSSFPNDQLLLFGEQGTVVGAAVANQVERTSGHGRAAMIVTVPDAGWVAADHNGSTAPVAIAGSPDQPARPGSRFLPMLARDASGATASPDVRDGVVYADDFVKWLQSRYGLGRQNSDRPILLGLDNEPDLWGTTHAELRGRTLSGASVLTGFDELVTRTAETAAALKDVAPEAVVLAPGFSGWFGLLSLGRGVAPNGYQWYVDYFLERLRASGERRRRRLIDVLDVHWYPEARNTCGADEAPCWSDRITNDYQPQSASVIAARVQAPRSLWDPSYMENSWIATAIPGCSRPSASSLFSILRATSQGRPITRSDVFSSCAIQLLPRLEGSIAAQSPGTKIAITEYYFGRGGDISGAIAQADALGIFGREGVFAAALWPSAGVYAYNSPAGQCNGDESCATLAYRCIFAAFKAFLDYDGRGHAFGDTSLSAQTSDVERVSVYAATNATDPRHLVVIGINKTAAPVPAILSIESPLTFTSARAWSITGGIGACTPPRPADGVAVDRNTAQLVLPPYSINIYWLQP